MIHFINVWVEFGSLMKDPACGFTTSLVLWQLLKREESPKGLMLWFWRGTGGILEDRISPVTDRWCKTLQQWQRSVISSHVASVPTQQGARANRTISDDTKLDIRGKEGTGTSQGSVQHMQTPGWGLQETSEKRGPSGDVGEKSTTGFLSPPCLE